MKKKILMGMLCIMLLLLTSISFASETSDGEKDSNSQVDSELSMNEIANKKEGVIKIATYIDGKLLKTGSGFFINDTGTFVTNYHVIAGADDIKVLFDNEEIYSGVISVLKFDKKIDLAILKIFQTDLKYLEIEKENELKVGDVAVTISSPYGYINTMSAGMISAIRDDKIQITAPISAGSSGGPALNSKGKVIGVIYSIVKNGENMGFVIPISRLNDLGETYNVPLSEIKEMEIEKLKEKKPQNFFVTSTSSGEILFTWDKVEEADYYWIKLKVSGTDQWYSLEATKGEVKWDWTSEFKKFPIDLPENTSLEMLVVPIIDNVIGFSSDLKEVTVKKTDVSSRIADPNLEAAIKHQIDNPQSELTESDLAKISSLELDGRNISDISGLSYLTNIEYLGLSDNNIENIDELKGLKKLKNLYLNDNKISSFNALSNLKELRSLDIHGNNIEDIQFVKNLNKLDTLCIKNNQISDISPLKNLKQLVNIIMDDNKIDNLEALSELNNLEFLAFDNNLVSDLTPLKGKHYINNIRFKNNMVSDIGSLSKMIEIEVLDAANNKITNISVLKDFENLRILNLNYNNISDISPIKDLLNLEILGLKSNNIINIDNINNLDKLSVLNISENPIVDYSPIDKFSAIKVFK